jgi:hypothetical protein
MQERGLQVPIYEWLASTFNPVKFNAREWVTLAKAAGMRYITITARHHDGFSMFATKATPYNIVDWTPFKRDPLKELADECHRQGLSLFFYYSQLDWRHPDYFPRGGTGRATGRPESGFVIASTVTSRSHGLLPDGTRDETASVLEMEVTEITHGHLDPALFEVPAGFHDVSPGTIWYYWKNARAWVHYTIARILG